MALILIVDDLAVNREFLVTLLGYRNHALLEAADGAEAIAIVKAKHPDLVICDVLMPAVDGFEFVRRLRDDPSVASVPVIFYSAHYQGREAIELAKACGVEYVLTKPCPPEEVLRAVDEALTARVRPVVRLQAESFHREHLQLVTDMLSKKAEELSFTNHQLASLVELDLKLGSERDPHKLLDEVCRGARELVGAAFGAVVVEDKNDEAQIYVTTSGLEQAGLLAPNRAALHQWGLESRRRSHRHRIAAKRSSGHYLYCVSHHVAEPRLGLALPCQQNRRGRVQRRGRAPDGDPRRSSRPRLRERKPLRQTQSAR
jgi:CheY-like chemotaxis protein